MITSEEQLRSLYAMPAERALLKQQVDLDRHCLRFIALSPLCIVATGGGAGALMDASPRGGKPGYEKVPFFPHNIRYTAHILSLIHI